MGTSATNNTIISAGLANTFASLHSSPTLAALLDYNALTAAIGVSYLTTGVVGSRIFTIQYSNVKWNYSVTSAVMNFQIQLYEGVKTSFSDIPNLIYKC